MHSINVQIQWHSITMFACPVWHVLIAREASCAADNSVLVDYLSLTKGSV